MSASIPVVGGIVGIAFLNILATLQNIWPTPWVRPVAEISIEIAAMTLILAMWVEFRGPLGKRFRRTALAVLLLLIAGRYGDITAPALFGRRIDLYWDLQHRIADIAFGNRLGAHGNNWARAKCGAATTSPRTRFDNWMLSNNRLSNITPCQHG